MAVVSGDVIFFVVSLVLGMLWLTISTSAFYTCYSFNTTTKTWFDSEQYCQQNGGKLVSMETEKEYQFINKTIQSLDVEDNEWYIGLTKRSGHWKWTSGTIYTRTDKWVRNEPNGNGNCVKMIKDHEGFGLFDDVPCSTPLMFICEYVESDQYVMPRPRRGITECNHTHYNISGDEKKIHTSSEPTTNIKKSSNVIKGLTKTIENGLESTTSKNTDASIIPSSITKSFEKGKTFPIMLVVIVLAVLLAICICTLVGVFCWFRRKSEKELKGAKSARNPSKRRSPTRSLGQDQSNHNNANSGGVRIVDEDTVHFLVPVDDNDYPRLTTHTMTHEKDLSTYADVHDAILPSAKATSKYYDDNNIYFNPVDTAPTLNAQVYESVELKPLQDVETRYEKETVGVRSSKEEQCLKAGAVDPAVCNNLYATADLSELNEAFGKTSIKQEPHQECKKGAANETPTTANRDANGEQACCNSLYETTDFSKPNKDFDKTSIKHDAHHECKEGAADEPSTTVSKDAKGEQGYCNSLYATTDLAKPNIVIKASKQRQEQKRRRDAARVQPVCCDNLYATTDLDSNANEDEVRRTQSFSVSTTASSFSNYPYASTGLIYLQDKPTEEGLEPDGIKEKPRDGQTKTGNKAKKKSRHPSIDSIMSASRKTKYKPSIPTPCKEATGDTMMYAMVDLLNNDKEARPVYAEVKKKHKK